MVDGLCEQKPTAKVAKICHICKFLRRKVRKVFEELEDGRKLFECIFLFCGHLSFGFGAFVCLPREMK